MPSRLVMRWVRRQLAPRRGSRGYERAIFAATHFSLGSNRSTRWVGVNCVSNPTPLRSTDEIPWPHCGNGPLGLSISEAKIGHRLLDLSKRRSPDLKCASPQEVDE